MPNIVRVIGGGLAGAEAAYQLARRGVAVELFEMRPVTNTDAHATGDLGELVCSNSLRSNLLTAPAGLLKEEMRRLGSLVIRIAEEHRVPAGSALAVDREGFASALTRTLEAQPRVKIIRREVTEFPSGITIIATGPLTSPVLAARLSAMLGEEHLYFYDAISPIVTTESIDMTVAYRAARYGKGEDDYINLPLSREQYYGFVAVLKAAERVPTQSFERFVPFEGCMPIEEMADRGEETLGFGPMRAVGLIDPRTGTRPYAVVQLRQENRDRTLYSLVGFQTKMTYPEQRRVFGLIPGLQNAEFVRLGSLHRNTFINAPAHLEPTLQWRRRAELFFAGQMTGVEGYIESAASGLLAGINAGRLLAGRAPVVPPPTTALGALLRYISNPDRKRFQPMNVNFGLLPPLGEPLRGRAKREGMSLRALADLDSWLGQIGATEGDFQERCAGSSTLRRGCDAVSSRRYGFFDIGTNTVLCLIAECGSGQFSVLDDLAEITRLGQGVDQTRRISAVGEERTSAVLRSYLARCATLGVREITAVGTSALRDAQNSGEVLARWHEQLGLKVRVISGEEEAACSFLAARQGLSLAGEELLVIDIGGGSTEFIRGNAAGISEAVSVDLGTVRLTERFLHSDPVTSRECESMLQEIDRALASVQARWMRDLPRVTLVGIAATFTTLVAVGKKLATYSHRDVHGSRVSLDEVCRQIELYQAMTNAQRKEITGLHPQRADVILAGAYMIKRIMTLFKAPHVIVSDQGVRYGLLHRRLAATQL